MPAFLQIAIIFWKFMGLNILLLAAFYILLRIAKQRVKSCKKNERSISFLHPNFGDCGGGEKVLWEMINSIIKVGNTQSIGISKIYLIGKEYKVNDVMEKLRMRFGICLQPECFEVIEIYNTKLLEVQSFLTMLFQIVGQIMLAFEIVLKHHSEYIIDTTGLPFTYIILKHFGFKVSAYIHYPFISDAMVDDVKKGVIAVHNNYTNNLKMKVIKPLKIAYYSLILRMFKLSCRCLEFSMTNSTWTDRHFKDFGMQNISKLFPPCNVDEYMASFQNKRSNIIVSFAQFRPEKNHDLQIEVIKRLKSKGLKLKLHMLGSVRNKEDQDLVSRLKNKIKESQLTEDIELFINLKYEEIKEQFVNAKFAIHTMKDEHFGIAVIEMMAAGLLTVAHNSAGPKFDIIGGDNSFTCGFLAEGINNIPN